MRYVEIGRFACRPLAVCQIRGRDFAFGEESAMSTVHLVATNPDLCRGCETCTLACSLYHEAACSPDLARLAIAKDMARYKFAIRICQHCNEPPCLPACLPGAMAIDCQGIITINDQCCTRCGACASSCPHDAILYSDYHDRFLKCNLCGGREDGPLCVELCPVGALSLRSAQTGAGGRN